MRRKKIKEDKDDETNMNQEKVEEKLEEETGHLVNTVS